MRIRHTFCQKTCKQEESRLVIVTAYWVTEMNGSNDKQKGEKKYSCLHYEAVEHYLKVDQDEFKISNTISRKIIF